MVAALWALLPTLAAAHTYTAISDAALVGRSSVIVRGTVAGRSTVLDNGVVLTRHEIQVADRIKGPAGERVIVLVAGGVLADGTSVVSTASPELAIGAEVLLFLAPGRGSAYRITGERQGAFRIHGEGAAATATRLLLGAPVGMRPLDAARWAGPRRAEPFVGWLRDTVGGRPPPADYYAEETPLTFHTVPFSLLQVQGQAARWTDPAQEFRTTGALPGETDGGLAVSLAAAAAWNEASGLSLTVSEGGGSPSSGVDDGINSILYTDPGDEINGSFDCNDGGTLGETRIRIQLLPQEIDGETFFTIVETDVVLQNGIECWLERSIGGAEELIGHELGHAVGIDHSDVLDALMFASAHGDGRGARLHEDDIAALRALRYGEPSPDDADDELPKLGKPRALRPKGARNDLPLALRFRTRDQGEPLGGPVRYYEVEVYERGGDEPLVQRILRFGRDLDDGCAARRISCDVLLDTRAVTSLLEPGGRYAWRLRAGQGQAGEANDLGPWSNRRKFRIRD